MNWPYLHRGVAGIATATLVAEWAGCLIGLTILLLSNVRLSDWQSLVDGASLRRLFALNRDILLRTLGLVGAYAWFARVGARSGDQILAANAVLRACAVSAFVVAVLTSVAFLVFGRAIIAVFTNQQSLRDLAGQFLPWTALMLIVSVWSFLLDGVFIGATRAHDLRNSMLASFAGFLLLELILGHYFGNHGLWAAFLCFMLFRAVTLYLRLPRIERASFAAQQPTPTIA